MSKLDDMTETRLHDRFDGCGFNLVNKSADGVVNEFPLRGVDMEVDYRQPGFQFRRLESGRYTLDWPSFVENIEVRNSEWSARPGDEFVLVVEVRFKKETKDLYPGQYFVVPPYSVRSAILGVYNSSRPAPTATLQNDRGVDRLVQSLALVGEDGEIASNPNFPHLGNLFLSRPELGAPVRLTSFTI